MESSKHDSYLVLEDLESAEWYDWLEKSLDGKAAPNASITTSRTISLSSPLISTSTSTSTTPTSTSSHSSSSNPLAWLKPSKPPAANRRLSLHTMFSVNSGLRAPSNEDVHRFWQYDPRAKALTRFFLNLPVINQCLDDRDFLFPEKEDERWHQRAAKLDPDGDHCAGDRFMDPGNTSLFDAAAIMTDLNPNKREFSISDIKGILLDNFFAEKHQDNNFRLGPKGLDYLNDFEENRRHALHAALHLLDAVEAEREVEWKSDGDVAVWIRHVHIEEQKIQTLISKIHINLRSWTMAKLLEEPDFDKDDLIAMLNTLYPPCSYEPPSERTSKAALSRHRNTYFGLILKLESVSSPKSRATIMKRHIQRMNRIQFHEWNSIRDALECYLELGGAEISDSSLILNAGAVKAEEAMHAFSRNGDGRSNMSLFAWVEQGGITRWPSLEFNRTTAPDPSTKDKSKKKIPTKSTPINQSQEFVTSQKTPTTSTPINQSQEFVTSQKTPYGHAPTNSSNDISKPPSRPPPLPPTEPPGETPPPQFRELKFKPDLRRISEAPSSPGEGFSLEQSGDADRQRSGTVTSKRSDRSKRQSVEGQKGLRQLKLSPSPPKRRSVESQTGLIDFQLPTPTKNTESPIRRSMLPDITEFPIPTPTASIEAQATIPTVSIESEVPTTGIEPQLSTSTIRIESEVPTARVEAKAPTTTARSEAEVPTASGEARVLAPTVSGLAQVPPPIASSEAQVPSPTESGDSELFTESASGESHVPTPTYGGGPAYPDVDNTLEARLNRRPSFSEASLGRPTHVDKWLRHAAAAKNTRPPIKQASSSAAPIKDTFENVETIVKPRGRTSGIPVLTAIPGPSRSSSNMKLQETRGRRHFEDLECRQGHSPERSPPRRASNLQKKQSVGGLQRLPILKNTSSSAIQLQDTGELLPPRKPFAVNSANISTPDLAVRSIPYSELRTPSTEPGSSADSRPSSRTRSRSRLRTIIQRARGLSFGSGGGQDTHDQETVPPVPTYSRLGYHTTPNHSADANDSGPSVHKDPTSSLRKGFQRLRKSKSEAILSPRPTANLHARKDDKSTRTRHGIKISGKEARSDDANIQSVHPSKLPYKSKISASCRASFADEEDAREIGDSTILSQKDQSLLQDLSIAEEIQTHDGNQGGQGKFAEDNNPSRSIAGHPREVSLPAPESTANVVPSTVQHKPSLVIAEAKKTPVVMSRIPAQSGGSKATTRPQLQRGNGWHGLQFRCQHVQKENDREMEGQKRYAPREEADVEDFNETLQSSTMDTTNADTTNYDMSSMIDPSFMVENSPHAKLSSTIMNSPLMAKNPSRMASAPISMKPPPPPPFSKGYISAPIPIKVKPRPAFSKGYMKTWAPASNCRTIEDKLKEPNQPKLGTNTGGKDPKVFLNNVLRSIDPAAIPPTRAPTLAAILHDLESKTYCQEGRNTVPLSATVLKKPSIIFPFSGNGSESADAGSNAGPFEMIPDDMNDPIFSVTCHTEGDFADADEPPTLYDGYAEEEVKPLTNEGIADTLQKIKTTDQKWEEATRLEFYRRTQEGLLGPEAIDPSLTKLPEKPYLVEGSAEHIQMEWVRLYSVLKSMGDQFGFPPPPGTATAYLPLVMSRRPSKPRINPRAEQEDDILTPLQPPWLAQSPGLFRDATWSLRTASPFIHRTPLNSEEDSRRVFSPFQRTETAMSGRSLESSALRPPTPAMSSVASFFRPRRSTTPTQDTFRKEFQISELLDSEGRPVFSEDFKVGVPIPLSLNYGKFRDEPVEPPPPIPDILKMPQRPQRAAMDFYAMHHLLPKAVDREKMSKWASGIATRGRDIEFGRAMAKTPGHIARQSIASSSKYIAPGQLTRPALASSARYPSKLPAGKSTPSGLSKEWGSADEGGSSEEEGLQTPRARKNKEDDAQGTPRNARRDVSDSGSSTPKASILNKAPMVSQVKASLKGKEKEAVRPVRPGLMRSCLVRRREPSPTHNGYPRVDEDHPVASFPRHDPSSISKNSYKRKEREVETVAPFSQPPPQFAIPHKNQTMEPTKSNSAIGNVGGRQQRPDPFAPLAVPKALQRTREEIQNDENTGLSRRRVSPIQFMRPEDLPEDSMNFSDWKKKMAINSGPRRSSGLDTRTNTQPNARPPAAGPYGGGIRVRGPYDSSSISHGAQRYDEHPTLTTLRSGSTPDIGGIRPHTEQPGMNTERQGITRARAGALISKQPNLPAPRNTSRLLGPTAGRSISRPNRGTGTQSTSDRLAAAARLKEQIENDKKEAQKLKNEVRMDKIKEWARVGKKIEPEDD